MVVIDVAKSFSRTPFGRYRTDGSDSAERFREDFLVPALNGGDDIEVDFSRVALGIGSSFLEEAFGGLVRKGFDPNELLKRISIKAKIELYSQQVEHFIKTA